MSSIDTILNQRAKRLKPGESLTFTLIKGPNTYSDDPKKKKAEEGEDGAKSRTLLKFPRIAKFTESVKKPDFDGDGVMYEQDVPKAKSESDEEEEEEMGGSRRKKRKWRRNEAPRRQWIIESPDEKTYVGVPEANASAYVLINLKESRVMEVTEVNGFYSFSQPGRVAALSMTEAEEAITNQRAHITRYIMHGKLAARGEAHKNPSVGLSKARLLGKLVGREDDDAEDNDVMSDITFKNRRPATARARKELLSDLGDENLTVDDDGVIGGANDSEFGGSKRFGRLAQNKQEEPPKKKLPPKAPSAATFEAAAIEEDFYQRDVAAEYEDLDYDANEQFDDDDVDIGAEQTTHTAERLEEDDVSDDEGDEPPGGNAGLASTAGLKLLMAKARGEAVDDPNNPLAQQGNLDSKGKKTTAYNRPDEPPGSAVKGDQAAEDQPKADSTLRKVMAAAAKATKTAEEVDSPAEEPEKEPTGVEVDANGQRLITLQAIRREIWLHHGQIRMKRLMKIFSIKKDQERYNKFRDLVKELCIMKKDQIEGNMLVLKQHWSNMG